MYFVNDKKCILNFTLSLLIPIFNICTFSNSNKSFIAKITSLDEQIPKTVNTIVDKSTSKLTSLDNHQSNDVQNFTVNGNNSPSNVKSKYIDNKVINIGKSIFHKIRSLQKIYFLNICPILLEKNMFNQVHNANASLNLCNTEKKCDTVLISKLGIFVKQNASPG